MAEDPGHPLPVGDIVVNRQFCGPPESGNGGYVCGRLAQYVNGPATVRLMQPPPLDVSLDVFQVGSEFHLCHGNTTIGRAWAEKPVVDVPPAPGLEQARRRRDLFAGYARHAFPGCFVCGTAREPGDGLQVYAGPAEDRDAAPMRVVNHVACTWIPHESFCGEENLVRPEFCWAALDCPSGWSFLSSAEEVALLGEFSAELHAKIECGKEYIVAGWEISRQGRKRLTGSAIYSQDGTALAWARATWITIDPPAQ